LFWIAGIFIASAILLTAQSAHAVVVTLDNGNSRAVFHTEASDGGILGMNTWLVDGIDHMYEQWFWYRVGSQTREHRIDGTGPLVHTGSPTVDLDFDTLPDFLLATYTDSETIITPEQFRIQLRYGLTGGSALSNRSDMVEVIRVENRGPAPLNISLFQYVDFDLNNTAGDDSVQITGLPANTARQADPLLQISETVVTPPPSRWTVGTFPGIRNSLDDAGITNLSNSSGPLFGTDAEWAFQWDDTGLFAIPPGGSILISKDKNIRPGVLPEPSSFVMAGLGVLVAVGYARWRRRG
jgi:hypothetical protein